MLIIFIFLLVALIGTVGALTYLSLTTPDDWITPVETDRSFINAAEWESRAFGWYDDNCG